MWRTNEVLQILHSASGSVCGDKISSVCGDKIDCVQDDKAASMVTRNVILSTLSLSF